jgi:hypothetical protein
LWRKVIESNSDAIPQSIDGSAGHFAQCVFELGKDLFDGIEVRTVGWQKALRRPGGLDGFSNAGAFVGTEVVHHHDFAWRQSRHEHLLDIGEELRAVDGTVEDTGSGQAIVPQRGQKSCRLPMTERRAGDQSLASFTPPVTGCHVGRGPGLVDKYKPSRIKAFLHLMPSGAGGLDVRAFLLGGMQGFF